MEVVALRDWAKAADPELHAAIKEAMDVVAEALHVYPSTSTAARPELIFSFNGGKDSTVVVHIIRAVAYELAQKAGKPHFADTPFAEAAKSWIGGIVPAVYFEAKNEFPEVLDFMDACSKQYGFSIEHLPPFERGLQCLLAGGGRAVLLGQRKMDPHGGSLDHFTPCSLNWPAAMRVLPILTWSYRLVWAFLLGCKAPYCHLYDAGYTSLGSTKNTIPNPRLETVAPIDGVSSSAPAAAASSSVHGGASAGAVVPVVIDRDAATAAVAAARPTLFPGNGKWYLPAYCLLDGACERWSRGEMPGGAAAASAAASAAGAAAAPAAASAAASTASSSAATVTAVAPATPVAPKQPTAAVVIVGDEVLAGRVVDVNGPFLCSALSSKGIRVVNVTVIPDEEATIAATVSTASHKADYVVTAGGLGPAHDDVTMHGVAEAFGYPLRQCDEMATFLRALHNAQHGATSDSAVSAADAAAADPTLQAVLRMAQLPCGPDVRLLYPDGSEADAFPPSATVAAPLPAAALVARGYPLVRVRNVYIFPGVPTILRRKWRAHQHLFVSDVKVTTTVLHVHTDTEARIAAVLEAIADGHPETRIGSYPGDVDPMAHVHGGHATPRLQAVAVAALPPIMALAESPATAACGAAGPFVLPSTLTAAASCSVASTAVASCGAAAVQSAVTVTVSSSGASAADDTAACAREIIDRLAGVGVRASLAPAAPPTPA